MKFLECWPEIDILDMSQGLYGARSRKPTRLLLLNLPKMVPELRRWQIASEHPTGISIGRTESGGWATSVLKEYPPAFCCGLASGFMHSLAARSMEQGVEPDPEFRRRAQSMVATAPGACIGPDYAQ